jgi:hypothetical protein
MACGICGGSSGECSCVNPQDLLGFLSAFRTVSRPAVDEPSAQSRQSAERVKARRAPATALDSRSWLGGPSEEVQEPDEPAPPGPAPDLTSSPTPGAASDYYGGTAAGPDHPPVSPQGEYWAPPPSPPPAVQAPHEQSGSYPPPAEMFPTVHVHEENRLAGPAQAMGVASLIVPPLAIPAIVCAAIAWIKTLIRPDLPGRWRALRAVLASMILAPIGITAIGTIWAHMASNLTNFGSGSEVQAIPFVSPGAGYSVISSHVGSSGTGGPSTTSPDQSYLNGQSGGAPTQVILVSNQTSLTVWANRTNTEHQSTFLILAPSPSLGQSLFSQMLSLYAHSPGASGFSGTPSTGQEGFQLQLPGGATEQLLVAERGSVIVATNAVGDETVQQARSDIGSRLSAELAVVPSGLAHLDKTTTSYAHRHNEVYHLLKALAVAEAPILAGLIALLIITALVEGGRKVTKPRSTPARGWYADPAGRFPAREWTGREWTSRVVNNYFQPVRDPAGV